MAGSTLVRLGPIAQHRWGLVTTAQAEDAGVTRKQLSRLASTGAIERVAQGVYRMAGAPSQDNEAIYATWLALGGASTPRSEAGVSSIVAGGITATVAHGIGDSFLDGFDFIVPARKGTRLPGVRLRIRELTRDEVIGVNGLPTLTIERTIADLVDLGTDFSLVADALRDAVRADKLTAPDLLVGYLSPVAARRKSSGSALADHLFDLAGVRPENVTSDVSPAEYAFRMTDTARQTREPLTGPTGRLVAAHRSELLEVLRRRGVTNPEIFGSSARGDDHEGSDLDLLVDFAPGTDLIDMVGIKHELEDVLGAPVDLIPRAGMKERVRVSAERDLVPL